MTKLEDARRLINEIDAEMARLFEKRMRAVEDVIQYKMENDLPIFDEQREKEVLINNVNRIEDVQLRPYYESYLKMMMEISKQYQRDLLKQQDEYYEMHRGE